MKGAVAIDLTREEYQVENQIIWKWVRPPAEKNLKRK